MNNEVTAFVISSGKNLNYEYCIKALENQTVKVRIDIIKNYHPMSAAFQQMLFRCTTPYYIEVDEDMVLNSNAIEIMYNGIKESDTKTAMLAYQLKEVHFDYDIWGVKIYKYEIFQKYPYNLKCLSCEVEQLDRLTADGYEYKCLPIMVGQHSPYWTNKDIYERYFNLMEKFKKYHYTWLENVFMKLWRKLQKDPSELNLHALLGAYTSLISENIKEEEKDYIKVRKEYTILKNYLSEPVSATIYMSSDCNFKCTWCYRQHEGIQQAPDMDPIKLQLLLNKYPSIGAVCICGYGNPTLSPNLNAVIKYLKERNIFVGLIVNGSVLEDKLPELEILPNYISISLNASNAEKHKRITQTDTFEKVLRGIRLSINKGIETYISYVCTRENLDDIPAFIQLANSLKVNAAHLHNLLPHFKEEDNDTRFWQLVLQKEDFPKIEEFKKLPGSEIVKLWPTLIDKNEKHNNCPFPWASISVDGSGNIGICNSVFPTNSANGNLDDFVVWQNSQCQNFRSSVLNGQITACQKCFRNLG